MAASLTFYTGEEGKLYANCKNISYADSTANITILYPDKTVWIANASMAIYSTGQFYYNFTVPEIKGNYLAQVICRVGGITGYDDEDFWVKNLEE